MALTTAAKAQIVKTYQKAKNDTGSSEVQIALLTARIEYLTEHLKANTHDVHTRFGLTKLVSKRRRLLNYLKKVDVTGYRTVVEKLQIRG
jgi:small subunit ribosomal protein S15